VIEEIQRHVRSGGYYFTVHAFERFVERNISPGEVREILLSGEVIEEYPKVSVLPSCLVFGKTSAGRILHVQCSSDPVWIITAYDPTLNPEEWEEGFKRRKKI